MRGAEGMICEIDSYTSSRHLRRKAMVIVMIIAVLAS